MRKMEEINNDYGQAAAQLGDLAYKQGLIEDNLEELEHQQRKLKNKMKSLAAEAVKVREELTKGTVTIEEKKDESKES